jgi:hypothetical protein
MKRGLQAAQVPLSVDGVRILWRTAVLIFSSSERHHGALPLRRFDDEAVLRRVDLAD